ncbi:hypothetical protein FOA32_000944 [Streptococcus sinensis]|nr:hypothetical protein [Streptococcus sinensis]
MTIGFAVYLVPVKNLSTRIEKVERITKTTGMNRATYNGQCKKVIYCSYKETLFLGLNCQIKCTILP